VKGTSRLEIISWDGFFDWNLSPSYKKLAANFVIVSLVDDTDWQDPLAAGMETESPELRVATALGEDLQ
jgi:hypothetical protein